VILLPSDLVAYIRDMRARDLVSVGQLRLLLIRLDSATGTLASTLEATLRRGEDSSGSNSKTAVTAGAIAPASDARPITRTGPLHDPSKLRGKLNKAPHFVAVLGKRRRGGSPRVTVGRGRTMDIILKDPSVSASHAWLDCDEEGIYFVHDDKSTNGTRVNGRMVAPGDFVDLAPGDMVRFGEVKVIYCLAKTLHDVLRLR